MRVPRWVAERKAWSTSSNPEGMAWANSNQKSNMSPSRNISDSSVVVILSHSMKWRFFAAWSSNRREPRCESATK